MSKFFYTFAYQINGDMMKLNKEMSNRYKGLTIYDSKNKEFPYFVREWGECFTEDEIREHWNEDLDFANIIVEGKENENKVYVLTELDSEDATWCFNEVFKKRENAIKRLHELYRENVVMRNEIVSNSEFNENEGTAHAVMEDGVVIAWRVKECNIL